MGGRTREGHILVLSKPDYFNEYSRSLKFPFPVYFFSFILYRPHNRAIVGGMITIMVMMTKADIYLKLYKFKRPVHNHGLTDRCGGAFSHEVTETHRGSMSCRGHVADKFQDSDLLFLLTSSPL